MLIYAYILLNPKNESKQERVIPRRARYIYCPFISLTFYYDREEIWQAKATVKSWMNNDGLIEIYRK
jgi:hypothetical protein